MSSRSSQLRLALASLLAAAVTPTAATADPTTYRERLVPKYDPGRGSWAAYYTKARTWRFGSRTCSARRAPGLEEHTPSDEVGCPPVGAQDRGVRRHLHSLLRIARVVPLAEDPGGQGVIPVAHRTIQ